jgi:hypothetical protein
VAVSFRARATPVSAWCCRHRHDISDTHGSKQGTLLVAQAIAATSRLLVHSRPSLLKGDSKAHILLRTRAIVEQCYHKQHEMPTPRPTTQPTVLSRPSPPPMFHVFSAFLKHTTHSAATEAAAGSLRDPLGAHALGKALVGVGACPVPGLGVVTREAAAYLHVSWRSHAVALPERLLGVTYSNNAARGRMRRVRRRKAAPPSRPLPLLRQWCCCSSCD